MERCQKSSHFQWGCNSSAFTSTWEWSDKDTAFFTIFLHLRAPRTVCKNLIHHQTQTGKYSVSLDTLRLPLFISFLHVKYIYKENILYTFKWTSLFTLARQCASGSCQNISHPTPVRAQRRRKNSQKVQKGARDASPGDPTARIFQIREYIEIFPAARRVVFWMQPHNAFAGKYFLVFLVTVMGAQNERQCESYLSLYISALPAALFNLRVSK